jgi:hypothetical protein
LNHKVVNFLSVFLYKKFKTYRGVVQQNFIFQMTSSFDL